MTKGTDGKTKKNYVQVVHEYGETPVRNGWTAEARDVWYAVRPVAGDYRLAAPGKDLPDWDPVTYETFTLMGGMPVYVTSKEDVAGLRKLLDAIEKELD